MRLVSCLLALLAAALPAQALAQTYLAAHSASRTLACGMRVSEDDVSRYPHLRCVVGVAIKVQPGSVRVQPRSGPVRSLRFVDETQFETDSGEGALNGLTARDHVCAVFTPHRRSLTALVVAFDPSTSPCGPGKRLRSTDGKPDTSAAGDG